MVKSTNSIITSNLTNRDIKRAQANNNACHHRLERDTLNRSNVNKRGPKVEGDEGFIPSPHGYSNLKPGVTCTRSRNIITLPDGSQVLEGSASHIKSLAH